MSAAAKIFTVGFLMAWVLAAAEPNSTGREAVGAPGEAPAGWTIPYGKEFWRRPLTPPQPKPKNPNSSPATITDIDLGDIIDRVSHAIVNDDPSGAPRVRAKTYMAAFEGTGVRFSPHHPGALFPEKAPNALLPPAHQGFTERTMRTSRPLPDPDTGVTLRTRSVRCGDQFLYERSGRSLNWSLLGNTCQALLNERIGLVEHYEAGKEGVEVSWVLKERPAGEGTLEIEIETEGLSYVGASDEGIHLADATGTPRVRIGRAVAVDSAGRRSEVAMSANADRVCVRVSGEVLATATYPLAIDPLISPEFGMDEPVIVPEPGLHHLPAVAWNGTNWLVVWTEWHALFDSPVDVVAARVSPEGRVLDPFGITISRDNPPPASPAVASNGKDYFVVWERYDGPGLRGARVTAEGQITDEEEIVVSSVPGVIGPSVAGDSAGYFVVWQHGTDIHGTRVGNEGVVLDSGGFQIGAGSSASVARGPDGYLVVWSYSPDGMAGSWDIFGTRLDRSGAVLDANGIAICTESNDQGSACVAANANGYLVVWQDSRSTGNAEENDIYAALVSRTGVVSHPQGIAVSTSGGNQARPSIAPGADNFLVVWNDGRANQPGVYASRVSPGGTVLDPEGVLVDTGETFAPAAAAFENGFLVVWDKTWLIGGTVGSGILGARLNGQAQVIDAEKILITAKDNDEASPAVSSNGTNWLVVWQDSRNPANASDIYGVRITYEGTVLDPAAIPISTEPGFENAPAVASAGGDYLVVWSYDYVDNIYGTRVRGDGTVIDLGGIAICTAPGWQYNAAVSSDGTNYLVVWQDGRETNASDIYAARVNQTGIVLEPDGFPISARTDAQSTPAIAFNGRDSLVVWTEWYQRPQSQHDIWGTRVSPAGVVLDAAAISISRATNAQTAPVVASAGTDFLVIWGDTRDTVTTNGQNFGGHIYGARVNAEGRVLDSGGLLISTAAYAAYPALTFNGSHFLAVWDNRIPGVSGPSTEIRAAWIDRNGSVLLRDLTVNTNGAYPAVAAGASNNFVVIGEGPRNGACRVFGHLVSFVAPPHIESLTLANSVATLSWRTDVGKTYRVQFKAELGKGNWNDLEPLVTASNSTASMLDLTIGQDSQRFYRVIRLPQ